jgi:uncharacterized protein YaaN involved in tellurite resistance
MSLKRNVQDLSPENHKFGFFGRGLSRFFTKYEKSQNVISDIVQSLRNGKKILERDNVMLEEDKKKMIEVTKTLSNSIVLGIEIDKRLADKSLNEEPERMKYINDNLIFPLKQRIIDLQQQLAVNQQGILTTEIIIRNNRELINGVNRAINVTVNALQIAVVSTMALNNQKKTINKIKEINKTTNELILSTSQRLKSQGVEIHKQSCSSLLDVDTLKASFKNVTMAIDDIMAYREKAIPEMNQIINEFDSLSNAASQFIEAIENNDNMPVKK